MATILIESKVACLVISNVTSHEISIIWKGENAWEAKFERSNNFSSILAGEASVSCTLQPHNSKKTTFWFLCDSSCGLLASGIGPKPSANTTELLISDLHFPESFEVSIVSPEPNLLHKVIPVPELYLSMKKWNKDRSLRTFKGNTIVCNLRIPSHEHNIFGEAQNKLKQLPIGYSQAFLPPSSFHVTILSLVNEGNYSKITKKKVGKEEEIKWETLHRHYKQKVSRVLSRYKNTTIRMKVKQFEMKRHFGAIVEPADERAKNLIEKIYSDCSNAAGFRMPTKNIPYHVSLSYGFLPVMPHLKPTINEFIQELEAEFLPLEFEVLPPFFAVFNDMGVFEPF